MKNFINYLIAYSDIFDQRESFSMINILHPEYHLFGHIPVRLKEGYFKFRYINVYFISISRIEHSNLHSLC